MNIPAFIDGVIKASKTSECIVVVQQKLSANVRWANTTLTTNGQSDQIYVAIFAIENDQVGSIITSVDEHIDGIALLRNAEAKARAAEPTFDYNPVLPGNGKWETEANTITDNIGDMSYIYLGLEPCFTETRSMSLELFGYTESKCLNYWVATSKGLRKYTSHQESIIELNLKTSDFKKSVWAGMGAHTPKELDLKVLFARLKQKMQWSEKSITLPAGKYETILEPSAVADLLIYNYWSSAARDADEGNNSYARANGKNAIGERVCNEDITIYSDPHAPGMHVPSFEIAYSTSAEQSIFDNGLELEKTSWIKNGVVDSLITPRYWAKKQNRTPRPLIPNLLFEHPSGKNLADMIAKTKYGLLVTCLWYIREVDPQNLLLTGLTRDGVFLIEDGEVKGAVNNFRFNMSPVGMLKQTTEIGINEPTLAREFGDYFTFASMPPLRVKDFNMSTVSDAV